jgi:hypothetical protein
MTAAGWFLLSFIIYRVGDDHVSEPGEVIARSCAAGEAWIRGALQPGQALFVGRCEAVQERMAQR